MPRFAFTVTGSLHLDDPQVIRAAAGPVFSVDGHAVEDTEDAVAAIQTLLRTTLRTGMAEVLGHGRAAVGRLHVNVVEVPEVDLG